MMVEVTREEFENLVQRVATLEEREEERAVIARAFAQQGRESAERARRAQQASQGLNNRPIASSA